MGLMIGIELDRPCGELVRQALAAGLLINVTHDTVIRMLPPLILERRGSRADRRAFGAVDLRFFASAGRGQLKHHGEGGVDCMSGGIRHFLQFADFNRAELEWVFERSRIIKDRFKRYQFYQPLADRTLAMVFEKASTRTRVSFEAGMYQMGGSVIHITTGDSQLGRAEPIEDTARVISRMVDIVMIRTFEQAKLERFAAHSRVPVINGLTNEYHPCQILADIFTFHRASRTDRRANRGLDRRCEQHGVHVAAGAQSSSDFGSMCRRRPAMRSTHRSPRPANICKSSPTRWKLRAAPTW